LHFQNNGETGGAFNLWSTASGGGGGSAGVEMKLLSLLMLVVVWRDSDEKSRFLIG